MLWHNRNQSITVAFDRNRKAVRKDVITCVVIECPGIDFDRRGIPMSDIIAGCDRAPANSEGSHAHARNFFESHSRSAVRELHRSAALLLRQAGQKFVTTISRAQFSVKFDLSSADKCL